MSISHAYADYAFPYFNDFETAISSPSANINGRDQWLVEDDWTAGTAHDSRWQAYQGNYFLDNNKNAVNQSYHQNQSATLADYITIPGTPSSALPVVTFWYAADVFSGSVRLQVQRKGQSTWQTLHTFEQSNNHVSYTKFEHALDNYKGDSIRFRFFQTWQIAAGARAFTVDDFYVGNIDATSHAYPYFNNFEVAESTASVNGRDQWIGQGDWNISTPHDMVYQARSGQHFLDSNYLNTNQQDHYDHDMTMQGYISIPNNASLPHVSFWYQLFAFSGGINFEIQTLGDSQWRLLQRFDEQLNHNKYTQFYYSLAAYRGKQVRFRFRQRWTNSVGARYFMVDDFSVADLQLPALSFPYLNNFESATTAAANNGRDQWNVQGDWYLSKAHHNVYQPYSGEYFLDNNANDENQINHQEHWADLMGFVPIPADAVAPELSFFYKADVFTGGVYVYIQQEGEAGWRHVHTFDEPFNHEAYTQYFYPLDDWKGKRVRIRFRQYWQGEAGARLFSVDNVAIAEQTSEVYRYPYNNDFEAETSNSAVNGRDHWNHQGDWNISQQHHSHFVPYEGSYFLDNNAANEDQRYHLNQDVIMLGFVPIPASNTVPVLSFWYQADIHDGAIYLYIQEQGSNQWTRIQTFDEQFNHDEYTRFQFALDAYKGKNIRIRFRQSMRATTGARLFSVDNISFAEQSDLEYGFPYVNDFEAPVSDIANNVNGRDQWNHQGDWGVSTPHHDYSANSGQYFLDNNADNKAQRYHREHNAEMYGYVPIPADAQTPVLTFWYRANVQNGGVYLYIQTLGSNEWTHVVTFNDQLNHNQYTKFEHSLDAYKGQSIRLRFRQYWGGVSDPRLFTVDDVSIAEKGLSVFSYPYEIDFEHATSDLAANINGRDQWNHQGDWSISTAHDSVYYPNSGAYFIDNNERFENQKYHREHFMDLFGFVPIPNDAVLPTVIFDYRSDIFSGLIDLQVQIQGRNDWIQLHRFDEEWNHQQYTQFSASLDAYKGQAIRFRFRQYWHGVNGPRVFTIDNFKVANLADPDYGFPYFNDFEQATSNNNKSGRDHWNHEGDWGISDQSTATGSAYSGDWYLDNNPLDEQQRYHRNHYVRMQGFIGIPATAFEPKVSFYYQANMFSGEVMLEVQRYGERDWQTLLTLTSRDNNLSYRQVSASLNAFKGEKVRFRFNQYWNSATNDRAVYIDDFSVSSELLGLWYFEENWLDDGSQRFPFSVASSTDPEFTSQLRAKDGAIGSGLSTCYYPQFTNNQYLTADNSDTITDFKQVTISLWVKPSLLTAGENALVSKGEGLSLFLDVQGGTAYPVWRYAGHELRSNYTVNVDEWTHIAATFSETEQHLFINGIANASAFINTTLSDLAQPIAIAAGWDDTTKSANPSTYYTGAIDELRIYQIAQTASQINDDINQLHACQISCQLGAFNITPSSTTGLACPDTRVAINIQAMCNDGITIKNDYTGNVSLASVLGSAFYSDAANNNAIADYQFTLADEGEKTLYLYHNNVAENVPVTVSDSADNIISTMAQPINFYAAGFRVTQQPQNHVCGNGTNMVIQAYGKQDNQTGGSCAILTNFTGDKTLKAWFGANLHGNASELESTTTPLTINGNNVLASAEPSSDNLSLAFAQGQAAINLSHLDAANVTHITLKHDQGFYQAQPLVAVTDSFTSAPETLFMKIQGADWLQPVGAQDNVLVAAGDEFTQTIGAQCSDGSIAVHYRSQQPIELTHRLVAPIGGESGALGVNSVTVDATSINGSASVTQTISEVGIFDLTATAPASSYFGMNILPVTLSGVGRFTPKYFEVTVSQHGRLGGAYGTGGSADFVYTGHMQSDTSEDGELTYVTAPQFNITAKNSANNTTKNYTGDFIKLPVSNVEIVSPASDAVTNGLDTKRLSLTAKLASASLTETLSSGVLLYQFSAADNFVYTRNANSKVPPFNADIALQVMKITDQDGVSAPESQLPTLSPAGVEVRFGRWWVDHAYGPETSNLTVPMFLQYWNGSVFITNEMDSVTEFDATAMLNIEDISLAPATTSAANQGQFTAGYSEVLNLIAPGAGNQGEVKLNFNIPNWLKYDWSGVSSLNSSTMTQNPSAIATFGQFRGNDRIINWREVPNN